MEEWFATYAREQQRLTSSLNHVSHIASDAQTRVQHLERELHDVKQRQTTSSRGSEPDKAFRWCEDTQRDTIDFENISGNAYIQALNNISATPQTIAETINTNKTVIQRKKPNNSFR
eukprot:729404-Pelagomonas_calceolata.AAC.1